MVKGGTLATLDKRKEKLVGGLLKKEVNYWIGLTTENKMHNKWAWINNVPVSYNNFRSDLEFRTKGHNCATILKESSVSWIYRDCNNKRNYVCEKLVDE